MKLISVKFKVINTDIVQTVNARELHQFLESRQQFVDWIQSRINKYGFTQNEDFLISENSQAKEGRGGDRKSKEYHISLGMAKELCMVERNEKGRQARKYFLDCEKKLKGTLDINIVLPDYDYVDPVAAARAWADRQEALSHA